MDFQIDHDYVSILAEVRRRGRLLEPAIRSDLPALLGHRLPSGLQRAADAARDGRLARGYGRDMLPVIIAACDRAIRAAPQQQDRGGLALPKPSSAGRSRHAECTPPGRRPARVS